MILLQTNKISKSFGPDLILSDISIEVQSQERVALVGRNGAGKSTLLKIIAGDLSYDSGNIFLAKNASIGYLAQHNSLNESLTIIDEMRTVFTILIEMEKTLREMELLMGDPDQFADQKEYQKLLTEYDQLQLRFKEQGGYTYQSDIRTVLNGLSFGSMDEATVIASLSGGQKTRLALAKMLLQKPDVLILDEPTNHLDIDTLTWLESYLKNYPGAILIVSHDRYFLDHVVTKVYEISQKKAKKYHGNYSHYLDEKAKDYELELKAYEKQQKEVAELSDFIQRNLARASTTRRAQSRRKKLERMDLMDRPKGDEKSAHFAFQIDKQSGNDVLKTNQLTIGYEQVQPLFSHLSLHITRGESVALVGPNGIGKTTLLKTIANRLPIITGQVTLGSHVSIGYYDQEQAHLKSNKSVLAELWDDYPLTPEKDIRTLLGNFLFSGDDVLKSVSELSGGEKARLALAKLMMQKANLLILDEPTNHLDLDSKEVLENALIDYPGTLLFVSHDRYFINRVGSRVIELSTEGVTNYLGDYDYYVEKKAEQKAIEALENAKTPSQKEEVPDGKKQFELDKERKKQERQLRRQIEALEEQINRFEERIEEGEARLLQPEVYSDVQKAQEIHAEMEQSKLKLDQLMHDWEQTQVELDDLSTAD